MTLAQLLSPWLTSANIIIFVSALTAMAVLWGLHIRDLARQRAENVALQSLAEEIFTARTVGEIHESLSRSLQALFDVGSVAIYAHNRAGNSLHALAPQGAEPAVVPLETGRAPEGLRLAFQQKEALLLEDPQLFPSPVLWLPMSAEGETNGILECRFASFGRKPEQPARHSLQHLANQVAFALLLLEQRQMREEILRGERLGAALELISGIASEVRAPLERIRSHAHQLLGRHQDERARELSLDLQNDADYANGVLDRLVSFGKGAPAHPSPFDLNALMRSLIAFRSDPWRLLILEPDVGLCPQQLPVFGVRGQLEQALLGLLVHAEQSMRRTGTRKLTINTQVQGTLGVLSMEFGATLEDPARGGTEPESSAMGLSVVRGIIESHSGTLTIHSIHGSSRIEVKLPLTGPAVPPALPRETQPGPRRSRTLLVCLAAEEERRRLVEISAHAGHRAVPAGSAAEALELLERLKFDAVLAGSALPDMLWTELIERVRGLSAVFILVDSVHTNTPVELPVLRPPFEEMELETMLGRLPA